MGDFEIEGDYKNIIADTIKLMVESIDILSNELSDDLLQNLYNKTNIREALPDHEFTANLIFSVYSCYKTLKGSPDWDLTEQEFNQILITWHLLLGIECLRRNKMVKVKPFKILDFDTMAETKLKIDIDERLLQSLMN